MAALVAGFDADTPRSILAMAGQFDRIGGDVPYLSILTPFQGTGLYDELKRAKLALIFVFLLFTSPTACHALARSAYLSGLREPRTERESPSSQS